MAASLLPELGQSVAGEEDGGRAGYGADQVDKCDPWHVGKRPLFIETATNRLSFLMDEQGFIGPETGIEASTSPPPLPRWFGPRASPDDPAVSALIDRVARGAGWADIGGGFNLNVRIDAEPPVVLRVHRPWVRRGRVAGLRRLRERLQRTQVRVARPIRISGCDLLRVGDRWAEIEEFIGHVQPPAGEDSYVRLFEELGRLHTALKAVWEPSPPEPLDDHRTLGQLRYSVGFTRRRLGPRSEPVVRRMRQLTGELSQLRKEVELPCAPIHGDYKLGNAVELSDGSWATFDLDFARVRERLYDVAGSLDHVAQGGAFQGGLVGLPAVDLPELRRLLDAYEGTAPEPLTRDEHRWLPGALALVPLHWAATAGLVGGDIREAESAMTAAEAWWSRRAELSS
jgi:Ser/Thr protein kinase RdoA (MazF antagonist)